MQCRSHSRRRTSECLFVTACSMDQYAEEKRTEKNLIVRSGISEAETTNNKGLRSTFCIEAIQTRSIARPLCDSRASWLYCDEVHRRHEIDECCKRFHACIPSSPKQDILAFNTTQKYTYNYVYLVNFVNNKAKR